MSEDKKQFFAVRGNCVAVSRPTKSGGRIATFSTGSDLVKVFFKPEDMQRLPLVGAESTLPVTTNELVYLA